MTDFYEKIVIGTITLIIGIIIKHMFDCYLNKITKLKYTILHSYIGSSINVINFGSVKLMYNNCEVTNLYSSSINIKNNSNKDLNDLELNISCNANSLILFSHGKNINNIKELEYTKTYSDILNQKKQNNTNYIYTNRDYKIPVINRGDIISITLLTTNHKNEQPILYVNTQHKGVKLKYYIEPIKLGGAPQLSSIIIGLFASLIICLPILYYIDSKNTIIILILINGWTSSLYGILFFNIIKWYKTYMNNI